MSKFPDQNVPQGEKTKTWFLKHFDYAKNVLRDSNGRIERFTKLYNTYNGRTTPSSVAYLTKQYGRKNRTKYISYKISRPKIDLLNNEFLQRPLHSTVTTINADAKSKKLDEFATLYGASVVREDLSKMKDNGVNVLDGADLPNPEDESYFSKLNVKDKNEVLMQTIVNQQIKSLDLKEKFAKNFQDIELVSMCFGRVEVDANGNENYMRIDPRRAIFEEIEGDTFGEKSPIMGHVEEMTIHDVLTRFKLDKNDAMKLRGIRDGNYSGDYDNNDYFDRSEGLSTNVIFLEWKGVEAEYFKHSPKTQNQMDFDDSDHSYVFEMNTEKYEENIEKHKRNQEKGKYKIETKYREVLYHAVLVGDDIMPIWGEKEYTMRRVDSPADVLSFSYVMALFNTVAGERVSLQEIIENFSNIFDVTMFQILKELNKAKGKILGYDRAVLPEGKKLKHIMYDVTNDSFLDYDSNRDSNTYGQKIDITQMFKEIDLGLSSSFPSLIALKSEILATVDRLTGINENRQGDIKASSTATNAQSAILSSRTITEGMFYLMGMFTEKALLKIVETTKITWGLGKSEKSNIILGDEMHQYLVATQDLAHQDYGVHMSDGGQEVRIREKLDRYTEAALNAKDLRYQDLIAYEVSPTLSAAKAVLDKAFKEVTAIRQQEAQAESERQGQLNGQNNEAQMQLAKEDREDKQAHDVEMSGVDADNEIRVNQNRSSEDARNKMIVDQNSIEQNGLNSQQGT